MGLNIIKISTSIIKYKVKSHKNENFNKLLHPSTV